MVFEKSKFIWVKGLCMKDSYGEFFASFTLKNKNASVNISVDGDYTLYINGKYVSSSQYGDYEHYKIYDQIDISNYVNVGENSIAILVWHFGESSSRYKLYNAGLIFEILQDNDVILASDEKILSRKSITYQNGKCKKISSQLGFSYAYDATKEDSFPCKAENGFEKSILVTKNCEFFPRPIKKHSLNPTMCGKVVSKNDENTYFLFDLGEESVGFLTFSLNAENECDIVVSYGECLENGRVKRKIGDRDFSIEYHAKKGENSFTNYMLRFACRYIEISTHSPVFLEKIGIIPQVYDVKKIERHFNNDIDKKIYDICVNTLEKCMLEHYVDCPWREQALYAFDSRNQMLSGYLAFENGNFDYARANLLLISKDRRNDGILSICFPSGMDLTIPSFSLHYITALKEYLEYSGDKSLIYEVDFKIKEIFEAIFKTEKNSLVQKFSGKSHWNFYDWSYSLEGSLGQNDNGGCDIMINLLTVYALLSYKKICEICTLPFAYDEKIDILKQKIKETFFIKEDGLFSLVKEEKIYHSLPNSLAILLDIASDNEAKVIAEKIIKNEIHRPSLSMKVFEYDALIKADIKNKDFVLNEIRKNYGKMLSFGSSTVWETELGDKDFDNAGSLCHGWSAIAIKYLI